ncbi:hypothetical protein G6F39_000494 [Rhizopus arrhizus]|nr:hypothetical protein G6F39_000494 [Rhizopus arrhizus]
MDETVSYHFATVRQRRENRNEIKYHLTIRQQPKQSRMCGIGEKADRRPIDPPPIVQFQVMDPNLPPNDKTYLQNPYYFMYASLMAADLDEELHLLRDGKTRSTTGSVVSSLYHLKDIDNTDAGFFVFPDLSVRMEGSYRLKLSLFEIVGKEVFHCESIISNQFFVYSAKKFPGMEESTFLSRSFADQGLKIRIRKELRQRRKLLKGLTWDEEHIKNNENKYCYCGNGYTEDKPMIRCIQCQQLFHGDCIHCLPKPLLFGDNFGTFTCSICSDSGSEIYERKGLSWIIIVHLVIYNLIKKAQVEDAKKPDKEKREHYYFRWKEDVCAFIDDYWGYLLPDKQRSATWNNTIASVLSTHSTIFLSGFEKFKQSAWWTLHKIEPPTGEKKTKVVSRAKPNLKKPLKRSKKVEEDQPVRKLRRTHESKMKKEDLIDLSSLSELSSDEEAFSDSESTSQVTERKKTTPLTTTTTKTATPPPPSSVPLRKPVLIVEEEEEEKEEEEREKEKKEEEKKDKSFDIVKNEPSVETPITTLPLVSLPNPSQKVTQITLQSSQDEWFLLQKLEHATQKLPYPAVRYKRKLAVRRLKRNLGIKLFDLDHHVLQSLRNTKHGLEPISQHTVIPPAVNQQDIHQNQPDGQQLLDKITFTPYASSFASRLFGSIRQRHVMTRDEAWLSSWNGRKLRPFIRRDFESKPSRMLLMASIKACGGKPKKEGIKVSEAVKDESIDYVYFQKEHLVQVNQLLSRSFWEGIDVSESLLFPEYSIVALYKRHVIGCAFMTPEAYVTYIAVDPGWGNAGIGQFMLYHLFQTAISKDVTLHVSANNNAMLLYQKFGFKPEEFIVNFYDKYLPANSAYSKNAFYLRLRR